MTTDINKIIAEYSTKNFDFGFSGADFDPSALQKAEDLLNTQTLTLEQYQIQNKDLSKRLKQAEQMIMPLLTGLLKTADQDYIYWPNRKIQVEQKIKEFITITRP